MTHPITIGTTANGTPVTWNPQADGPLLITGGAASGKTWFRDHSLIPRLVASGYHPFIHDGADYMAARYEDTPVKATSVADIRDLPDSPAVMLIVDHVEPDDPVWRASRRVNVLITRTPDRSWPGCRLTFNPHPTPIMRGREAEWHDLDGRMTIVTVGSR